MVGGPCIFMIVNWIEFETRSQMPGSNFKLGFRYFFNVYLFICIKKKQQEEWTEF
jgi:hypothetical protein